MNTSYKEQASAVIVDRPIIRKALSSRDVYNFVYSTLANAGIDPVDADIIGAYEQGKYELLGDAVLGEITSNISLTLKNA